MDFERIDLTVGPLFALEAMATISTTPSGPDESSVIRIDGAIDRTTVPDIYDDLKKRAKKQGGLSLDLSAVDRIDSAGVAFFSVLNRHCQKHGGVLEITAMSDNVDESFRLFRIVDFEEASGERESLPVRLGDAAYKRWDSFKRMVYMAADTFVWSVGGAARTRQVRKGALWVEANRIGVDAIGIVGLISFLVGGVVALQSAYQLRQFGADIFVANLIAVSMTREMGPLMTAIIIAGRSGASVAAEIATMTVNEEMDALRTLGLEPVRYVVVPKFQGLTITMPALTIMASFLGIVGGFVVALLYLDMSAAAFFSQVLNALVFKDIGTGLIKSVAFAWLIVLIAAKNGFEAYGGAEAVGKVTTESVVGSIFWVIVADAGFNVLFYFGD